MLCNLTTHNANELRNSRVAQKILEQFRFYATDYATCDLSINTIHGQPVAQHAMLHNMIDREWAPL
jgi:hypothetical protein